MFCERCGKQLPDSAAFCPSCGSRTEIPDPSQSSTINMQGNSSLGQQMNLRQESIVELNRIYSYFSPKASLYNEYDQLQAELKRISKPLKGLTITGVVILILLAVFDVFLGLLVYENSIRNTLIIIAFVSFCPLFLGLAFLAVGLIVEGSRKKKYRRSIARLDVISKDLSKHYSSFGPCIIGIEFSNPKIVANIRRIIQAGRADDPKEAINVMLDDSHKNYMQLQSELQTRSLNSIKTSSAVSAGANVTTAGFCAADFFIGLI